MDCQCDATGVWSSVYIQHVKWMENFGGVTCCMVFSVDSGYVCETLRFYL